MKYRPERFAQFDETMNIVYEVLAGLCTLFAIWNIMMNTQWIWWAFGGALFLLLVAIRTHRGVTATLAALLLMVLSMAYCQLYQWSPW